MSQSHDNNIRSIGAKLEASLGPSLGGDFERQLERLDRIKTLSRDSFGEVLAAVVRERGKVPALVEAAFETIDLELDRLRPKAGPVLTSNPELDAELQRRIARIRDVRTEVHEDLLRAVDRLQRIERRVSELDEAMGRDLSRELEGLTLFADSVGSEMRRTDGDPDSPSKS
jgi:hypothetical protein